MRRLPGLLGPVALAALLAGCGSPAPPSGKIGEVFRAEQACDTPGLPAPLRTTVVFLDARAIRPSANAREFVERNGGLRDLMLSIAEPGRIQTSGVTALRERVSLAVVPADGGPAHLIFTGCPPGLSAAELAAARKQSSGVGEWFTGDVAGKYAKQAEAFADQLIGALNAAGGRGAAGGGGGPVAQSSFLAGIKASQALLDVRDRALRLILVTDLSTLSPSGDFAKGLEAGRAAGGRFGLAEVHLVAPAGRRVAYQAFLGGWLLAQGAQLASTGSGRVAAATPPPRRLWSLEGEAAYPRRAEPIAIRLGDDGTGKLAGAWLTLRGTPDRATPMTGTISCTAGGRCDIRSDDGGFAQVWGGGGAPHYDREWPFGGMRSFRLTLDGNRLTGRVYDEGVQIGANPDRNGINIAARITGS